MPHHKLAEEALHYELDDFTAPWRPAETLWIQHGIGRSGVFFRHWVPQLAGRFRVLRPDLRGHGRSFDPGPDYGWSLDDLLGDILRLMDALELDRMHYVGESAGGVLGLAFAALHPDRLISVTALSSPLVIPQANLDRLVNATGFASMEQALKAMSLGEWTRAQFESGGLTVLNATHADWVVHEWEKNRIHNLCGIMSILPGLNLEALLPKIRRPTLLLAPTRSRLTTVAQQEHMATLIPGARVRAIDGRAHEIYVDRADECIAAFLELVDDIETKKSELG